MKTCLERIPQDVVALCDYERLAPEFLPPDIWAYLAGGAADERGLKVNQEAYRQWSIQPQVLVEMHGASSTLQLRGGQLPHPFFIAPMAAHRLFHAEGELATALGAAAMGAPLVMSCRASTPIEAMPRHLGVPLWFQLYVRKDREFMLGLVRRLEDAGCDGLVVTVDAPVSGIRNREQRAGFRFPEEIEAPHLVGEPAWPVVESVLDPRYLAELPTWEDLIWLKNQTRLPVWLKGVLSVADAQRAVEASFDGLVVSNHGGRTLDVLPAPLKVLPEISREVAGRIPVLVDGGIRRGTDAFIALALGADAVMVGRPMLYALAVAGAVGVAHALRILCHELEVAMLLAGCPTLPSIRGRVRPVMKG
ncbi:4-hydroxymandelate oxidase [Haloferula luteola]|uniref:4-hydroxymandelate oxidase n=1 Tax=Haloferula luteola TaxID=595692 RepID=A0A840UZW1_9BACT|nr:alpha-hydroxy acid oxidase [Haloferula luteola]MBB5351285.1 4-hydroxymandelate oxidase [Haloferula luteola]